MKYYKRELETYLSQQKYLALTKIEKRVETELYPKVLDLLYTNLGPQVASLVTALHQSQDAFARLWSALSVDHPFDNTWGFSNSPLGKLDVYLRQDPATQDDLSRLALYCYGHHPEAAAISDAINQQHRQTEMEYRKIANYLNGVSTKAGAQFLINLGFDLSVLDHDSGSACLPAPIIGPTLLGLEAENHA